MPFSLEEGNLPPADQAERYDEMNSAGRRGEAVEYFMREVVGLPPEFVSRAKAAPFWQAQEALAHTLAYDTAVMGDYSLSLERPATVTAPTLAMASGESPPFMRETTRALADTMPNAQHRTLDRIEPEVAADAPVDVFRLGAVVAKQT